MQDTQPTTANVTSFRVVRPEPEPPRQPTSFRYVPSAEDRALLDRIAAERQRRKRPR